MNTSENGTRRLGRAIASPCIALAIMAASITVSAGLASAMPVEPHMMAAGSQIAAPGATVTLKDPNRRLPRRHPITLRRR